MRQVISFNLVFFVAVFMLGSTCEDSENCCTDVDTDTEDKLSTDCSDVSCWDPPKRSCTANDTLQIYAPNGHCSDGECIYESWQEQCHSGLCDNGECFTIPCQGMICNNPPARYCDGDELVIFEPYGVCDEGGFCSYAEQRHSCIEPCVDAKCGEDDACTWVICDKPPASYCHDDSIMRVYAREGLCEDGFCSYISSDINCPTGCDDGRCIGDPCLGVICDMPPAAYCDREMAIEFGQ